MNSRASPFAGPGQLKNGKKPLPNQKAASPSSRSLELESYATSALFSIHIRFVSFSFSFRTFMCGAVAELWPIPDQFLLALLTMENISN